MIEWFATHWQAITRAVGLVVFGLLAARWLGRLGGRIAARRGTAQTAMLTRRLISYGIYIVVLMTVLSTLGFDLKVLAGAAGILTVAVGFASQTSASNIISGLFLVGERPFVVGDVIRIGQTTGEVIAIDLLSIKLRTFDNLYVRLPNETVIKSEVTNLTHFPIRRFDLAVSVPYGTELGAAREVLLEVARQSEHALEEPKAQVLFLGYGESGMNLQLSAWATRDDFSIFRYALAEEVKRAMEVAGMPIPFARRDLQLTEPIIVRVDGGPRRGARDARWSAEDSKT